jgi:hypothetical protein
VDEFYITEDLEKSSSYKVTRTNSMIRSAYLYTQGCLDLRKAEHLAVVDRKRVTKNFKLAALYTPSQAKSILRLLVDTDAQKAE